MIKKPLENRLGWSFTRHRIRDECLRRLYWQYYGSWGGWSDAASDIARQAYALKELTTPPLVVGQIVHDVIGRWLRTRVENDPFPLQRLIQEALGLFDHPPQPIRYFSDVYLIGIEDDELVHARQRIAWLLERASEHRYVRRLCRVPPSRIVVADETKWDEKRVLYGNVDLYGVPDVLVYSADGLARFIDWKTGRDEAKGADVQMGCQALFAREKLGVSLREATGHLVYFDSGDVVDISNLDTLAECAESLMDSYIADLTRRLSDVSTNVADIDRFPMTDDEGRCKRCNFRLICGR